MVSIFPCVSYQGWLTSQRRPRFSSEIGFHLERILHKQAAVVAAGVEELLAALVVITGAPIRKSAMSLPVSVPSNVKLPFGAQTFLSLIW